MAIYDVHYHISSVFIWHCSAEDVADARKQFEATTNMVDTIDKEITHADIEVLDVKKCYEAKE